jgi:hypothetical protein
VAGTYKRDDKLPANIRLTNQKYGSFYIVGIGSLVDESKARVVIGHIC